MNILKNVFNWTVGSFFRTIGRVIAFILIGFIIFQLINKANIDITNLFLPSLSASTLTPKSTFSQDTNNVGTPDYINGFGSNNTYSYSSNTPSVQGKFSWGVSSTGTAVSGQAWALSMGFTSNLNSQTYYDLTINFRDRDLRNNVNTSSIRLFSGNSTASLSYQNLSLIGVTNNATSSSNTNKLVVRFYTTQPVSIWGISIFSNGGGINDNITSVNNFGISSVSIEVVDMTNSDAIINNQTNNTQNIINNQNNTTQQIIDTQNELLGQKCGNLFNKNGVVNNTTFDSSGNSFSANGFYATTDYIEVKPNTRYSLDSYNGYRVVEYNSSKTFIQRLFDVRYFTTSANTYYIKLSGNTSNINNTMLNEGSSSLPYCEYGSYSSKLDQTNDLLNDDDSSGATSQATSFFNNFTDNDHGLSSIITLPLNSIRLMLSDNCVAPHTVYKGATISFPCGDILWSRQGASDLKDFLNIVYGGLICYYIIVNFFLWVNRFKNPENDKIEVVDL